ncbi:fimbrillin family protein, partial [Sinorhizobium sp. GL28]|uniref:fimbrillin family protein n=1 Tax=Sinorhizobium sp. GL28 TaxID=1358418 RepID=UPI000A752EFF
MVRIAASVGTTTRTLPDGATETEQQQFVNNDKIAVEATYTINGTNETKSVQYQYADGQWNSVDGDFLTWRKKASAFQFKSFYPADGTNSLTAGCVYADQTTTAAMAKSDYMTATVNTTTRPADCMLRLGMDRQTARLILNIKKIATEFPAGTKIHHVVVVSSKDVPVSSQQVEISPKQQGDGGE